MSYIVNILGHVSAYGLRAEDAIQHIIEHTIEECAFIMCQKTGLKFDFLTPNMKTDIMNRIMQISHVEPVVCQGRTKHGRPCKRMTLYGFCTDHRDQESKQLQKKRRCTLRATERPVNVRALRMMKYQF